MNPRLSILAAAAVVLASSACARKGGTAQAAEAPKFTIPHSMHVEAGLACTVCHAPIAQATRLGPTVHVALPTGNAAKACADCHEKVPANPPPRAVDSALTFSHAAHLGKVNGDCTRCHKALVEPGATRAPVPPMSACTDCHNHAVDYAQARCQPCHVDLKRYPLKPVSDFRHAGDFLKTHGQMAKTSAATCAACHEQTSCAECHAATTRPVKPDVQWPEKVGASFIHRGDYVSRHVIEANADPASCRRCHGSAFCEACHNEQNVAPQAGAAGTRRDPHPNGWYVPGSGGQHAGAARQNIVGCAGCHDQGSRSTCVLCHQSGGLAGNSPHPPGFGQRHNKTTDVANNAMCRACHH